MELIEFTSLSIIIMGAVYGTAKRVSSHQRRTEVALRYRELNRGGHGDSVD